MSDSVGAGSVSLMVKVNSCLNLCPWALLACLCKICRVGANAAVIPELIYASGGYQEPKNEDKTEETGSPRVGRARASCKETLLLAFASSQGKQLKLLFVWLVSVGFPRMCPLYLDFLECIREGCM